MTTLINWERMPDFKKPDFKLKHKTTCIYKLIIYFCQLNLKNCNMKDLVAKINAEIETFKTESDSLIEKGVKAAGARARKSTLEIEKLLKEFRKVSIEESKK